VRRLVVLHTNDIHGRIDAIARIATLVERESASTDDAVLYVDAGDVEDRTNRLSNLTKGVAVHRLLGVAGCRATAIGNGTVVYYGPAPLVEQSAAGGYPQLAANLQRDGRVVPGAEAAVLLDIKGIRVGLTGLTPADWRDIYASMGLDVPEALPLVREHAASLRRQGAEVVILLSHLGIDRDRELALELDGEIPLVIGSHSHTLLAQGERVGGVTIAQAGSFGEHLGRVELELDTKDGVQIAHLAVDAVPENTEPHPAIQAEIATIEAELESWLAEPVGELADDLDFADDRECAGVAFVADVLRERMDAEVGVVVPATALVAGLPSGVLTRGTLYEACPSPGVPSAADLTGAELRELVDRGLEPDRAAEAPRSLRGARRGPMHLSGAEVRDGQLLVDGLPVRADRVYRVAGTDWELGTYGGYVRDDWALDVTWDGTTIIREAIEEHLRRHQVVPRPETRIHGRLSPQPG
jgi:2',3'-cyclic-nucleotide 2'-phosphodiesterase (5'-nucleotidase family)